MKQAPKKGKTNEKERKIEQQQKMLKILKTYYE